MVADAYQSPPEVVRPLMPHIPAGSTFIEPCVGRGRLWYALVEAGLVPRGEYDVLPINAGVTLADATELEADDADFYITNPPWTRRLLHAIIANLSRRRPTWLLFDADWAFTVQAAPFMRRCALYVAVGRVIWFPGTMGGKDNVAWYLFVPYKVPTTFIPRLA